MSSRVSCKSHQILEPKNVLGKRGNINVIFGTIKKVPLETFLVNFYNTKQNQNIISSINTVSQQKIDITPDLWSCACRY